MEKRPDESFGNANEDKKPKNTPGPRQTTHRDNNQPRQPLNQPADSGIHDTRPTSIESMRTLDDALPSTPPSFKPRTGPPSVENALKRASKNGVGSSTEPNASQGPNEHRKIRLHGIKQSQARKGSVAGQQHEFSNLSQSALSSDPARPVRVQEKWRYPSDSPAPPHSSLEPGPRPSYFRPAHPPSLFGPGPLPSSSRREGDHKRKREIEANEGIPMKRRDSSAGPARADAASFSPTFRCGSRFDMPATRRYSHQEPAALGDAAPGLDTPSPGVKSDRPFFAVDNSDDDEEPDAAQAIKQEAGLEVERDPANAIKKEAPMGIKRGAVAERRLSGVMPGTQKPHVGLKVIRGEKPPKGVAVQVVDSVSTRSHKGLKNVHHSYETTEQETRDKRDTFIKTIRTHWPDVDSDNWIPMSLRPTSPDRLPTNPRNWTTELLEWLAALAGVTHENLERAHKAIWRRTGGGAVGWEDVRRAHHDCDPRPPAQSLGDQADAADPADRGHPEHVPEAESSASPAHLLAEDQDMKDVDETEAGNVKQNREGTPKNDGWEQQAPACQQRVDVAAPEGHINHEQSCPTVHGLAVQRSPSAQPLHQPLQFAQREEGERHPQNLPRPADGPVDQSQNGFATERELPSHSDTIQGDSDVSTMRFYGDFEFEYRSFGSDGEIRESSWGKGNGGALVQGGRIVRSRDSKREDPSV